jgi:type I restriction enzyme R subunit
LDDLIDIQKLIEAEQSDIFDVLEFVAFAKEPITREERVQVTRPDLRSNLTEEQREFIEFVLNRYIQTGVAELDDKQLPILLQLKYLAIGDAARKLGGADKAREIFLQAQRALYKVA